MKPLIVCTFLIASTLAFNGFSQTRKLETGKKSLTETSSSSNATTSTKKNRRTTNDDETIGDGIIGFFGRLLLEVVWYSTYGILIETAEERTHKMHDAEIASYPYKQAHYGNYIYTNSTNYALSRVDLSYNFLIENNHLYGNQLNANVRFLQRMGLAAEYVSFTEKNMADTDSFSALSLLIQYYRIRTQKFDLSFGLGVTHVGSGVNTSGFTYGFTSEWFIQKPMSFMASYKKAYINENSVDNTKLLLKYYLKKFQFSSGYQHFKIGSVEINTFSIGIGMTL